MRKETQQGLQAFRKQQEEADKKARGGEVAAEEIDGEGDEWVAGVRKRKRGKEKEVLKGVKIRRTSTAEQLAKNDEAANAEVSKSGHEAQKQVEKTQPPPGNIAKKTQAPEPTSPPKLPPKTSAPPPKSGLGLVDYGSDDDDW